jgi:ubiquinol-cytochrome c reductase cytochrome b/c1 subunit
LARDVALFLVLAALVDGLLAILATGPGTLLTTYYLAFFIHAGFTLYDGRFSALRTWTWLALVAAGAGAGVTGFLGYLLPWGQLEYWLASELARSQAAWEFLYSLNGWLLSLQSRLAGFPIWPILLLGILCLDVAVMHYEAWRRRSLLHAAIFLAAVIAFVVAFGVTARLLVGSPTPPASDMNAFPTPMNIVPSWNELPFFAMLRAVPDKLAGVVVMFAAMAVPVMWPWMHVDALRTGPLGRVWLMLCLAFAAAWIGLTWLGMGPPDPWHIHVAQALAIFYFTFFLVCPPLLRRIAAAAAGQPAKDSRNNNCVRFWKTRL